MTITKVAKIDFEEGIVDLFINNELVETISAWNFNADEARDDGWQLDYNYKR
jgi:hypothetical protein